MVTFSIPTMKCGGCAKSVTSALHEVDQAAKVTVDLDKKEITLDSVASEQQVLDALKAAGYPATIA
ncbi:MULTISPECIES: heavy-metal-associated domain-containing protein [Ochrobactrum]|uniref:Heavy-metal-associated domain-containing protein n=1 Tax=Ochrobactrum chromiisoli TaxID=2993941 RepID=A0ABT3QLG1_9HYPH|nr:heavy-metal-associated domain-containing protein [Ochrobactrum chromiisoli]MCX2696450.1 heavy-metal-associated domain-containing protein [Ochrobactrum chromiisoli]